MPAREKQRHLLQMIMIRNYKSSKNIRRRSSLSRLLPKPAGVWRYRAMGAVKLAEFLGEIGCGRNRYLRQYRFGLDLGPIRDLFDSACSRGSAVRRLGPTRCRG